MITADTTPGNMRVASNTAANPLPQRASMSSQGIVANSTWLSTRTMPPINTPYTARVISTLSIAHRRMRGSSSWANANP